MQRFLNGLTVGISTETKPTNQKISKTRPSTWYERDTKRTYVLGNNLRWILQKQDPLNIEGEADYPVSTQINEFGDGFPTIAPNHVFTLGRTIQQNGEARVPDEMSTGVLQPKQRVVGSTNMIDLTTSPLVTAKDAPFEGHLVFDTNNAQYALKYSPAYNNPYDTNGFFIGIWFKSDALFTNQTMFCIGSDSSGSGLIKLSIDSSNNIVAKIADGTNVYTASIPGYNFLASGYYYAAIWYDKSNTSAKKLHLFVGNQYEIFAHAETAVNTLNTVDTIYGEFIIGRNNIGTGYNNGFVGELANFQSFLFPNDPDWNSMRSFFAGIKEPTLKGYTTTQSAQNPTTHQFGTDFSFTGTGANGSEHVNYMFATDEGIYNFDFIYHRNTGYNDFDVYIDNVFYTTIRAKGSGTTNLQATFDKVHLSKGIHFMKFVAKFNSAVSGSTATNFAVTFILAAVFLNKIDDISHPKYDGGSTFLFFGSEARKRKGNWNLALGTIGKNWQTTFSQTTSPADKDYLEFDLYTKKGLYNIDTSFIGSTSAGHGIAKIYVDSDDDDANATPIITLDTHSSTVNLTSSVQVYLEGGHHTIKIKVDGKNSASSGYKLQLNSVRGELLVLSANDTGTTIYALDDDIEPATSASYTTNTNNLAHLFTNRFAFYGGWDTNAKTVKVRRFFAGGFYHTRLLVTANVAGLSASINGTTFTTSGTSSQGVKGENDTVFIPRGYQEVTLTTPSGSTSPNFIALMFKLIGKMKQSADKRNVETESSGLVPIARIAFHRDVISKSVKVGNITYDRFDNIVIDSEPVTDSSQSAGLCVVLNDINGTDKYTVNGRYRRPNDATYIDSASVFTWTTNSIYYTIQEMVNITGLVAVHGKVEIHMVKKGTATSVFGNIESYNDLNGKLYASWTLVDSIDSITKFGVCMANVNNPVIKAGSVIEIFARKKA